MLLGGHCSIPSINSVVYSATGVARWKPNIAQRHAFGFSFDENAFLETCTSQVSAVPTRLTLHISLGVVCGGMKQWTVDEVPALKARL